MSRSIAYLTSRVNFVQVSEEIPVTKQRNPDKVDPPDVFEGEFHRPFPFIRSFLLHTRARKKSEPEGTCGRPHGKGQTDRISYPISPDSGTGGSPGTRACLFEKYLSLSFYCHPLCG